MGITQGAYCIGCCWMLMLLLFAVGVMNLAWVALIAAFVLHIVASVQLTLMNRRANAGGYQQSRDWQAATAVADHRCAEGQ